MSVATAARAHPLGDHGAIADETTATRAAAAARRDRRPRFRSSGSVRSRRISRVQGTARRVMSVQSQSSRCHCFKWVAITSGQLRMRWPSRRRRVPNSMSSIDGTM